MALIRPLVVLGAPRSGTTLVYSILSSHPASWSLYRESEALWTSILPVDALAGDDSIPETLATEELCRQLRHRLEAAVYNEQRFVRRRMSLIHSDSKRMVSRVLAGLSRVAKPDSLRFVDKNPRYCLRLSFLEKLFPAARYLFVVRNPRSNLNSLLDGWRANARYETFIPNGPLRIRGYRGRGWCFLRPAGWQHYTRDTTLASVCAFQYREANLHALEGFQDIAPERLITVRYEDLTSDPVSEVRRLVRTAGLSFSGGLRRFAEEMPPVNTVRRPRPGKWRTNRDEIESVLPEVEAVARRLGYGDSTKSQ